MSIDYVRDALPLPTNVETQPKKSRPVETDSEITAARKGREAAMAGESIHSCPYHALYLSAAWRNGWAEARALRRRAEDKAYQLATDPPGKLKASQIGQRMSRKTMIERLGEQFA